MESFIQQRHRSNPDRQRHGNELVDAQHPLAGLVPRHIGLLPSKLSGEVDPVVSILSFWAGVIALTVIDKVTGITPVAAGRFYAIAWALAVGLELGRDVWVQRHRYASPRWLTAVDAAMGHEATVNALAALIKQHEHDPDYVVTRPDLRVAVQQERARRREAARRTEGFQRFEVSTIDATQVAPDEERRRRARERRAARQGRVLT